VVIAVGMVTRKSAPSVWTPDGTPAAAPLVPVAPLVILRNASPRGRHELGGGVHARGDVLRRRGDSQAGLVTRGGLQVEITRVVLLKIDK